MPQCRTVLPSFFAAASSPAFAAPQVRNSSLSFFFCSCGNFHILHWDLSLSVSREDKDPSLLLLLPCPSWRYPSTPPSSGLEKRLRGWARFQGCSSPQLLPGTEHILRWARSGVSLRLVLPWEAVPRLCTLNRSERGQAARGQKWCQKEVKQRVLCLAYLAKKKLCTEKE